MGWKDGECDIDSEAVCLTPFSPEVQGTVPGRVQLEGGGSLSYSRPPVPLPHAPVHPASVLSGFECVFCNFVCKTKNMFERHLQIHLITRMFECDVCHKFMKTPEQLLEHKKCHTVPTGGLK